MATAVMFAAVLVMLTGFAAAVVPVSSSDLVPNTPTAQFFPLLLQPQTSKFVSLFANKSTIQDVLFGQQESPAVFAGSFRKWARLHSGKVEVLRYMSSPSSNAALAEGLLHIVNDEGKGIALPVAVLADLDTNGRLVTAKTYYGKEPVTGKTNARTPFLEPDPNVPKAFPDYLDTYEAALATANVTAVVSSFTPDGSFRDASGQTWEGSARLTDFFTKLFSLGGGQLQYCKLTVGTQANSKLVSALEFITINGELKTPQQGLAVYEQGDNNKLLAARIYDDDVFPSDF